MVPARRRGELALRIGQLAICDGAVFL